MKIDKNQVVTLLYSISGVEENGEKTFIEKTESAQPFTFLYGLGIMLPKFEQEIKDLNAGDKKTFTLTSQEGYGERVDDAITHLPINLFGEAGLPPVGAMLPLQDPEGQQLNVLVLDVNDEAVVVDLNHPMAGKTLEFEVEILANRVATDLELEHGHAHPEKD